MHGPVALVTGATVYATGRTSAVFAKLGSNVDCRRHPLTEEEV